MILRLTTKARTLASIQGVLKSARIAPLHFFSVETWKTSRHSCLKDIVGCLGPEPWIVRSSCSTEDRQDASNAGAFLSVANVCNEMLTIEVENVIASYGEVNQADEVLIQPMLKNVVCSGVAFSHDPNTSAPYRIINWSEDGNTSFVTKGLGGHVWQQAASSTTPPPLILTSVVVLIEELLTLFGNLPIDCEFALTRDSGVEVLWLLQVRRLVLTEVPESEGDQEARLQIIENKVIRGMKPHPELMGSRTVYGVMPDWNPAEIIGIRPTPLALSLYRDLITDSVWAYQRHNYGYRNLRSFPLMPSFFGLPYIDVRVSFNSFIPADLESGLAGRLVDYYINRLVEAPTLHDKVEFEIINSCYTLDLKERLTQLANHGFSNSDTEKLISSLRVITNRIIHPKEGLWLGDAAKLDILNSRRDSLLTSNMDPIELIYWLIEDAKRYGTLPFAGLARAGFVAVQMLRSLVVKGIFSKDDYDAFIGSISTVNSQMAHDRRTLDRASFLDRYGYLRPGTYDIVSRRYDEAPDLYFDWGERLSEPRIKNVFNLPLTKMRALDRALEVNGLESDSQGLLEFMRAAIELRELAKFYFTHNLSDALSLINKVGGKYGFSREELTYCDIGAFKELYISAADPRAMISNSIEMGKLRYSETLKVSLPPLITTPTDVWAFQWPKTVPNFITQKQVTAAVVGYESRGELAGAIVCIPSADPGYDWLFAYPIAGLITAWGGPNSHMAIRAGELGLPAVIGSGEESYQYWSSAKRLHIDCAGRRVEVLK